MGIIDDFVSEYERQFDYWEAAARQVRAILEGQLASSGLRGLVTSRAKTADRLRAKLVARDSERKYADADAIRKDIPDLAGVRVALYFPGQIDEVEQIIRTHLDVQKVKVFPDPGTTTPAASEGSRPRRFSGYNARHFRVLIPEGQLPEGQERYSTAIVEVQVASVLMHAWSEVEHDLVYKPLSGSLSESEYALLDQLNGLMLSGEIALEQLQQAGEVRLSAAGARFETHFELAEFLRTRLARAGAKLNDATLGSVDILFDYLAGRGEVTADEIAEYLDVLEGDFERRPVADQLADLMLSGDEAQYNDYLHARESTWSLRQGRLARLDSALSSSSAQTVAIGDFVTAWVLLELTLTKLLPDGDDRPLAAGKLFETLNLKAILTPAEFDELTFLRTLRNQIMHGRASDFPGERLREAAKAVRRLTHEIDQRFSARER